MAKKYFENRGISKNLNVVIVNSPLPLHNKVGQILLEKLLKIIAGSRIGKVYLISGNIPNNFFDKDKHTILENINYDTRKDCIFIKIFKYIIMQLKFSKAIIKNKDKIDIVFFWISSALIIPMIISKLLRKKTIIIATGLVSYNCKILKPFELFNFYLADILGVESKSVIEYIGLNKYRKKCKLFHLYVSDEFNIFKPFKKRANFIGYIGRLSKEKGIMEFLDAIEILKKYDFNIKILIGGSGPLKTRVENYVTKFGDIITFRDWIPHDKIIEVLNSLKLLVIPSYSEGLPNILLESLACGTPVLATPVGGIPDLIEDEKTGFLMKNNSPRLIAENVMRALNNSNLQIISENVRNLIEEEYSYKSALINYRAMIRFLYDER